MELYQISYYTNDANAPIKGNGGIIQKGTSTTDRPGGERGGNPVRQAIEYLKMWDYPTSPKDLLQSMMEEDPIYNLFKAVDGLELEKHQKKFRKSTERGR